MTERAETTASIDDGLEDGLAAALEELENAAIERARSLVAEEAQALRERVRQLEEAVVRLQSRPQPTSTQQPSRPTARGTDGTPSPPNPGAAPPLRKAKRSRPGELPPLPAKRTLATLKEYLQGLGFTLVSYRGIGGGAWVFKPLEEFGHVAEHLKKNGIGVSRYPRGRKRHPEDHFEIDPSKVLPDK